MFEYKGKLLFLHSVRTFSIIEFISDVYVATDSVEIVNQCKSNNVRTITRGTNANHTDEPLLNVLNYCLKSIDKEYDILLTIMANCPGHTVADVDRAINLLASERELNEVRGFNKRGLETDWLAFRSNVILYNHQISSHLGVTQSNGFEVHYQEDLCDE